VIEPFPDLLPQENREAADPAELLDGILQTLRRYVALDEHQYVVVALWVAHTHCIEATSTTPYLHVTSPEPESGKSRLFEVIETLVPRPMFASSMTPAVLYRAVEKFTPTLLLDEVDNQLADKTAKAELIGLLNSGYRRGALAYRIGGARRDEIEHFQTFSAKAIGGLDDVVAPLASRCLRIQMRRRRRTERVDDFFQEDARAEAEPLRQQLAAWALAATPVLRIARPERIGIRDRLEEAVRLLLAIADAAGGDWPENARAALREVAGASTDGAITERTQLLTDVRDVFASLDEPHDLPTASLLSHLLAIEDSPWRGWWGVERDGTVVPEKGAARKLAQKLKPFGIKPRDVGERTERRKGYVRADFTDAFDTYLPAIPLPNPRTARTPLEQAKTAGSESAHADPGCADDDTPDTRMNPRSARSARIKAGGNVEDLPAACLRRAATVAEEMGEDAFGAVLRQTAFRLDAAQARLGETL
jgi:hypothetical protein